MIKITNYLATCLLAVSLAGCSSVSLSDLATAGGAVGGAAVGALTGSVPVVIATTTTGAAVGAVAVEETETQTEVLEAIPEEQRAEVAKRQALLTVIEHWGQWIIGGVVALILFAWVMPGIQIPWLRR